MEENKHSYQNTAEQPGAEKKSVDKEAGHNGDDCRCKEASKKTPMELLKMMIDDLSFWKK